MKKRKTVVANPNQKLDKEVLLAQRVLEAMGRSPFNSEELLKQVRSRIDIQTEDFADSLERLYLS